MLTETYFDNQINGYAGVDFNGEGVTAENLHQVCQRLQQENVGGILATIVTDKVDLMAQRLAKLVALRQRDPLVQQVIVGFHIEGPFLNETPGYRGAHPLDAIHPTNAEEMKRLLDAAGGLTRIVTLAPERDPGFQVTKMLADHGITVSAGHCDPSMDELKGGVENGLKMFTHLGNGCPMQMHRHDNVIQRALSFREHLMFGLIGDLTHLPPFTLGNFLRSAGLDRCFCVTDAISAAGQGPGKYKLGRWDIVIGEDLVAWAPDKSHFVGAAVTMPRMYQNLSTKMGFSDEQCRQLLCRNPRRAVGMGK